MINLAGHKEADKHVKSELRRCGIPTIVCTATGEVGASYHGSIPINAIAVPRSMRLNRNFSDHLVFHRAWSYWIVEGLVPIQAAQAIYKHLIGKEDVRVDGHCGCVHPNTVASHYTKEGNLLVPRKWEADYKTFANNGSLIMTQDIVDSYVFSDNCEQDAYASFVHLYHIDSELGLYFFVETLKEFGVIS